VILTQRLHPIMMSVTGTSGLNSAAGAFLIIYLNLPGKPEEYHLTLTLTEVIS